IYLAARLENSRTAKIERDYGIGLNMYPERLSSRPEDKTMMMMETSISNGKSEIFLRDLYSAIDSLSKIPPTNDELTAIKNRLKKDHNDNFERSGTLNHCLGTSMLNDDMAYFTDYNKIVDNLTTEDIVNAAKKYLDLNKAALTVVHPHSDTEKNIKDIYGIVSQIPFTGLNKKNPVDMEKISKYLLPNNFEIVLNDSSSDNIEFNIIMEEKNWTPKNAALSNVLSDMLSTSGTKTKSIEEISKQEDMLALDFGVCATQYGISADGSFPIDSFDKSLELMNDVIKNSNLSSENFEQAKARLQESYSNVEASVYEKFDPVMYEGLPRGFNVQDKLKALENLTLDDVKTFYNDIFIKSQGQVVVSAPFSKNPELKQKIFNSIGSYEKLQPRDISLVQSFKPIDKVQVLTQSNLKNQANIIEGFKFKHNGNLKDETCVSLLNDILGGSSSSRLFSDLREKRHLAYSVSSKVSYSDDIGVLTLKIGTTTENVETGEKTFDNIQKSIEGFNENIQRLMTEKVSVEELESVKKAMKSSLLTFLETNRGKTVDIMGSNNTPYGFEYINKQFEIIDTITPDDIYNTARYIFKSNPIYSLTATQASLDANKEFLDSLAKVQS
ncbi:MAG: insulinase family protein, partial [Candidatus Gastranaerophilales bacterium]|nr:insulinase family protein [Candidatus Gastranaerophilales bacterium]